MKKYLAGILSALGIFAASPTLAAVCNDPSGFLKLYGTITVGDALVLSSDCHSAIDGGAPGLSVGGTPISGGTALGFLYNVGGVLANSTFMKQITNGSNNPSIQVGNGSSTGDDSAVIATRTLTPASGLLNSHAFRDETAATINVTGSAFSGYAAFDAAYTVSGSATTPQNHMHGFQARMTWNATGTNNEMAGYVSQAAIGAGTIANAYGFFMQDANKTGGTITNQYSFFGNTLSLATNNYFLYQGGAGNTSVLPGNIILGGGGVRTSPVTIEQVTTVFNGTSQFGIGITDTSASASSGAIEFYRGTTNVGSVAVSSSATAYNTTSDERLKNFTGRYDPEAAEKIIRADPVRTFDWKADGAHAIGWGAQTSYGISHDLASPGLTPKDIWGMDFGKRTPYLWAAVSRLLDRVDSLERQLWKTKIRARH